MTDVVSAADSRTPSPGVLARFFGVLLAPRETYAAVAARPRSLGILAVTLTLAAGAVSLFMWTEVGQEAALDRSIRSLEAFGVTLPDEAYARMEEGMSRAWMTSGAGQIVFWLLALSIIAGLLTGIFSTLMGGNARFRHVFAIVAHSSAVIAVQQLFSMPLSYARGEFAGANLGVFVPMLEETSFLVRLLDSIDLFLVWWIVSLSIGLGVLYRRTTGGIATSLLVVYLLIASVVAFVRAGS